jgi:glycosyltransferase involved in cell wall biosynthesis
LENISLAAILQLTTAAAAEWRYRRRLAAKLSELVETAGVDLIEVADAAMEAVLYRPWTYPRVPFIVRLHGPMVALDLFDRHIPGPTRPVIRWAEGRLFHKATHLTAPSRSAERLFRKEMGLGDKAITVYPNMPTFDVGSVTAPAREDPDLVLYVGRHLPIKGVHLLFRAIPGVLQRRPHTRFVFVGPDGPTTQAYASSQKYLLSLLPARYRHAVEFTGYQPLEDVADFYAKAAVCVIPSLFESFGYTCLEAMMHGKAIVATPTGDMATMLDHGRCGLIYTPAAAGGAGGNTSGDLSAHIVRLLGDPELRRCLGGAARERALACYHPDLIAAQAESFYYRAIAEQQATCKPKSQRGSGRKAG